MTLNKLSRDELLARARAVESARSEFYDGPVTCWHRNPDGPDLANALEAAWAELDALAGAENDCSMCDDPATCPAEDCAFMPALRRENIRLEAQNKRYAEALKRVQNVIEQGYPGVGKTDKCEHDKFGFEECTACYDIALMEALNPIGGSK